MYLKEIEASGFKSFADKMKIDLDDKITCIVGPNGSGKSNIVDAVRWVLGEQSVKSLRGDSGMTDVIFSGSKNRKALNVASVSLLFDNSDNYLNLPYNEVSIKRRVFATGESEFFINGENCRLKDITELFMDSGIGKGSFNIVSQGAIDKIISTSNKDRRIVFEEAAGVLKYKTRKEEALNKLIKTEDNLNRVRDIVSELSLQIDPLKEQSAVAKEYLNYKEDLENIEIALMSHEIRTMNYSLKQNNELIEKLDGEILNLTVFSSTDDLKINELKETLEKLNDELRSYNHKLLLLTKEEEELNGEKKLLAERAKYSADDIKVYDNIKVLKEKIASLKNEIYSNEEDINLINLSIKNEEEIQSKKELELSNMRHQYNNLVSELNHSRSQVFNHEEKMRVLNNSIESGSAYSTSTRQVLNNPRLSGIHNCLGNLIDTDIKYAKALEVALLASKQYIVVDSGEDAKKAIAYLKENNYGRATFFPLDAVKPRGIDYQSLDEIKAFTGFISVFIDVCSYDNIYHSVIANQLGNVILVDDLDTANKIAKKTANRYKIVTLDGDVISVGGSITGGSLKYVRSTISDRQELELLSKTKDSLISLISETEKDINLKKENLETYENLILEGRSKIRVLKDRYELKKATLDMTNASLTNAQTELSSLEAVSDSTISKEEEKLMNKYYEVVREKESLVKELNNKTKEHESLSSDIEEKDAVNRSSNLELKQKEKKRHDLELANSRMEVKLDNYLNLLNEDYSLTYEAASSKYFLEIDPEEAIKKVSSLKQKIKDLGMINLTAIEEYERVSTRYEFLINQENDLVAAKATLLEIISEMDDVMRSEFKQTFENIEKEFKQVFSELFGGGQAELKLSNPNDLLETGVEIIASPPGKKLTTINLLSGGEKTLTAISLILAILNVRPVPFCLFDEIEAALDETNVDKFGKYLSRYKNKTQFLIITHKKKTMEYADTLYGITMQESGVSKLVSVRMEKLGA